MSTTLGTLGFPIASVVAPLIGAGVVRFVGAPRAWTFVGLTFATVAAAAALTRAFVEGSGVGAALAVNAIIAIVVLAAQPRRGATRRDVVLPLLWIASGALVMDATDARLVALGWVLPPLATWLSMRRTSAREARGRRLIGAYLVFGSLPLLVAIGLFAHAAGAAGEAQPFLVSSWRAAQLSPELARAVFSLVAVSVLVRLGVPPLHGWMAELGELLPAGQMLALTSVQMSVHVMVRMGIAPLPQALPSESGIVLGVGLAGALYGALMAASQHKLRRVVAYVAVAQSSALLVGIAMGDLVSVTGALANAISVAITSRGLMLAATTIEARVGMVDLRQMTGIAHPAPRLGAAMIMLGVAAVGLPGSLGFVGEDLLLQGLVHDRPLVAAAMVLAMALVGVALLRAVLRTCFGPVASWATTAPDLLPRERWLAAFGLAAALLGLWPGPLLRAHESDVLALRDAWGHIDAAPTEHGGH